MEANLMNNPNSDNQINHYLEPIKQGNPPFSPDFVKSVEKTFQQYSQTFTALKNFDQEH